jgi:hypothetical protein
MTLGGAGYNERHPKPAGEPVLVGGDLGLLRLRRPKYARRPPDRALPRPDDLDALFLPELQLERRGEPIARDLSKQHAHGGDALGIEQYRQRRQLAGLVLGHGLRYGDPYLALRAVLHGIDPGHPDFLPPRRRPSGKPLVDLLFLARGRELLARQSFAVRDLVRGPPDVLG